MRKVCIIGNLGSVKGAFDGQTIKTRIVVQEVQHKYGLDNVKVINSNGALKKLFSLLLKIIFVPFLYKNIVIMPAQNGLRVIAPLISILNIFFKRKTHYIVIGGWLPSFITKRKMLFWCLKHFSHIYVETSTMKKNLEGMGFVNVEIMLNCKTLNILDEKKLKTKITPPLKFCTFSRVMKQKGIEYAVNAINKLNARYGENTCILDIFGQIDENEIEWFDSVKQVFSKNIVYRGVIDFDKSVETLKDYDALIFPTLFYTEGIPGTIIDAYAAGIPVISSRWESFADVVDDNVVGFGYEFGSFDALFELLERLVLNPDLLLDKKMFCIKKAYSFIPENAMKGLFVNFD